MKLCVNQNYETSYLLPTTYNLQPTTYFLHFHNISKLPLPSRITSGSCPDKSIIVEGILKP